MTVRERTKILGFFILEEKRDMINLSIYKIFLQSGKGYSFRLVQEVMGCATAREIQVRF